MSKKSLSPRSFEEQARNVAFAYRNTQSQYDDLQINNEVVPMAAAIKEWIYICGCYMGIEQTMKLLIRMGGGTAEEVLDLRHDLVEAYKSLDSPARDVVAAHYRVYRSLHNFDPGNPALKSACGFIQHIGKGYVAWRYILTEDHREMPRVHVGMMLEIWRALTYLVRRRGSGRDYSYRTVAGDLAEYVGRVFRDAESDPEWQAGPNFSEIREWANHKGGMLKAGIDLFHHFHHNAPGSANLREASPLMSRVLVGAAERALRRPLPNSRSKDIRVFQDRIRRDDLAWNADRNVFESGPVAGSE